jgi:hypothetical protein
MAAKLMPGMNLSFCGTQSLPWLVKKGDSPPAFLAFQLNSWQDGAHETLHLDLGLGPLLPFVLGAGLRL